MPYFQPPPHPPAPPPGYPTLLVSSAKHTSSPVQTRIECFWVVLYYFHYVSIYQITREIRKGVWGVFDKKIGNPCWRISPSHISKACKNWGGQTLLASFPPTLHVVLVERVFQSETKIKFIICIKYQLATYLFRPFLSTVAYTRRSSPNALNNVIQPSRSVHRIPQWLFLRILSCTKTFKSNVWCVVQNLNLLLYCISYL